jgi:hypothetical protein
MQCETREKLKKAWDDAARAHTNAIKAMETTRTGILERQRADLAANIAVAGAQSEDARVSYGIHCKEHGCGGTATEP